MNLNASLYANAISGLQRDFHIGPVDARVGQWLFLFTYAFGCELWAPWSEEYGRWPVMQLSLLFTNIWQIPCALATNYHTVLIGRFFGGLTQAGGSVTLGMVADMWDSNDQQHAVNYVVLSSVAGSVFGPVIGGFVEQYLSWRWCFWVMLVAGVTTQLLHLLFVPETRCTVLLDREARRRRQLGVSNIWGPNEIKEHRLDKAEVIEIWLRPFKMLFTEPIVFCLSFLSGFSDALIFTFLDAFAPVFKLWSFGPVQIGLAFIS